MAIDNVYAYLSYVQPLVVLVLAPVPSLPTELKWKLFRASAVGQLAALVSGFGPAWQPDNLLENPFSGCCAHAPSQSIYLPLIQTLCNIVVICECVGPGLLTNSRPVCDHCHRAQRIFRCSGRRPRWVGVLCDSTPVFGIPRYNPLCLLLRLA